MNMNKAGLDAIKLLLKNWWKVILVIIAAGVMVSGYVIQIGNVGCNKQQIKLMDEVKKDGR